MSTWNATTVRCACGADVPMRIALGIHVTRAPAVRDDVLARRLHFATCACGERIHVRARFEYTDLDRKQLVIVLAPHELPAWRDHEAELLATMRQAFELGAPMIGEVVRALRGRIVFSQEELREKLVIWTAGIDDGLVECLKVQAFAIDPSLAKPASRLLVDEIHDDRLECVWFEDAGDLRPSRKVELPPGWLRRAEQDHSSLEARFPEFFRDGFVSANRMLLPRDAVVD